MEAKEHLKKEKHNFTDCELEVMIDQVLTSVQRLKKKIIFIYIKIIIIVIIIMHTEKTFTEDSKTSRHHCVIIGTFFKNYYIYR